MTVRSHLWLLVAGVMVPLLVVAIWLAAESPDRDLVASGGIQNGSLTWSGLAVVALRPFPRVAAAVATALALALLACSLLSRRLRRSFTWLHGFAGSLGHADPPRRRAAHLMELDQLQEELCSAEARLPRGLAGIESSALPPEALAQRAAEVALQVGGAERAVVYWLPIVGTGPALPAAAGPWPEQLPLLPSSALTALFAEEASGAASGEPAARAVVHALPTALEAGRSPASALAVAMYGGTGDVTGAVLLAHSRAGAFGAREERMIRDVAARVALALENRRLHAAARRAGAAADLATRLQDHVLSTSAHDLRSPLNTISVWSELLRQRQDNPDLFTRALDTIQAQVRTEAGLVDDLLNVSRMIADATRLEPGAVALAPLLRSLLEESERAPRAREVGVDLRVDAALPPVVSDGVRLGEVLRTLIATARRATPAPGRIAVRVSRSGRHALVEISHPEPDRITSPPEATELQVPAGGTILTKGATFITLRELTEMDGGTLEVERRADPPATAYTVALEFAPATWVGDHAGGSEPLPSLEGIHLLLVEDDMPARESLELLLAGCGARVTAVGSAEGARVALDRIRPDVVLSDLQLPGESGYALVEGLRARGVEPGAVPAIAVSAMAGERDRERAIAAGFQRHFGKPVAARQLVDAIVALTRGHLGC
jgi:signal transduction histidine kinase/CheY-like chemotaxis protein